jgi:hypothetical protein
MQLEEEKMKGFFNDNFSYLDIIKEKDFVAISIKEKEQIFEEVMNENIDIDKEVEKFLKSLYGTDRYDIMIKEQITIEQDNDDSIRSEIDSSNVEKSTVEKISEINVDVNNIDLMKQRQEKIKRINEVLNKRNQIKDINLEVDQEEEDLDVMKFD